MALFDVIQTVRVTSNYYAQIRYQKLRDSNRNLANALAGQTSPFSNLAPQLKTNPKFEFKSLKDLKSGDVILNRSNSEPLTYYALQGVHYQTLTHASIIYKPNPRKTLLVESSNSGLSYVELNPESTYFETDSSRGSAIDEKLKYRLVFEII